MLNVSTEFASSRRSVGGGVGGSGEGRRSPEIDQLLGDPEPISACQTHSPSELRRASCVTVWTSISLCDASSARRGAVVVVAARREAPKASAAGAAGAASAAAEVSSSLTTCANILAAASLMGVRLGWVASCECVCVDGSREGSDCWSKGGPIDWPSPV